MKRKGIFLFLFFFSLSIMAGSLHFRKTWQSVSSDSVEMSESQLSKSLYAKYAVLMDGDSGNILFGKNENEAAAMASTTKIMTLITALEMEDAPETCVMSPYAASQPKVHLGAAAGTAFQTEDLYYSMMLESHNDSAACIAENLGAALTTAAEQSASDEKGAGVEAAADERGTVVGAAAEQSVAGVRTDTDKETSRGYLDLFLDEMNWKAAQIGCVDTYFTTPNGLDREADGKKHHSTAADMARILKYCIYDSPKREQFLEITRTATYAFSDTEGKMSFHCSNHNQLLQTMEGAVSGKTGFTGEAGYCYVGAVEKGEKRFVVALLACGWPNNRSYKWQDMKKLIAYADEQYERADLAEEEPKSGRVIVKNAKAGSGGEELSIMLQSEKISYPFLRKKSEQVRSKISVPKQVEAPISRGDKIGKITYYCGEKELAAGSLIACEGAEKIDFYWCLNRLFKNFVV